MKRLNAKDNVIKPAIIGGVVIILGGVLLVYYACFAESSSVASYVVSALTVAVGIFLTVAAILRIFKIRGEQKIMELGQDAMATFISYDTNKSVGKVAVYFIKYSYEVEGKSYVETSPSQFNWYEVLTLKVVGQFPIKTLNGKSMLNCDLMKMHLDNREAVAELNKKYEDALNELVK